MNPLFLSRAKLRRDAPVAALAPVLLPDNSNERTHLGHRLIWTLFADHNSRSFLWREKDETSTTNAHFLILSDQPPNDQHKLFELETQSFEPALQKGDRLGFSLRANPVISRKQQLGERGKRHDVVMNALREFPKDQRALHRNQALQTAGRSWLENQARNHGFELIEPPTLRIDGHQRVQIPRTSGDPMLFGRMDFDGALEVQDPKRFLDAVSRGFGKAKGFGCGLMLIRRI